MRRTPFVLLKSYFLAALAITALLLPARADDTTPNPDVQQVPTATPSDVPVAPPAATPATPPQAQPSGVTPLIPPTPFSEADSARINDTAKGLAGMPSTDGSATWESTPEWKEYSQKLDGQWNYLNRVRLTPMRNWSDSQLGSIRDKTSTVFYPFSGPDVLYADTLFPTSKVLLMAGLEPIGSVPDLAKIQQAGQLAQYLTEMKTSLFTVMAASFFKTKDMKTDFHNPLVDGIMPAMIVFLARDGYNITAIDYVVLNKEGHVQPKGEKGVPGVQITFDDGRTLLYFQVDLGNDGQKNNPGFVKLMQRLAPGITYLKAASYLLYADYFSTVRNAILNDSVGIVEDDSGIPFHDFDLAKWTVTPYGNYTGPINLFKDKNQPDLAAFYSKTQHQPLTFGMGYKFDPAVSSVLVVTKKDATQ